MQIRPASHVLAVLAAATVSTIASTPASAWGVRGGGGHFGGHYGSTYRPIGGYRLVRYPTTYRPSYPGHRTFDPGYRPSYLTYGSRQGYAPTYAATPAPAAHYAPAPAAAPGGCSGPEQSAGYAPPASAR